MSDEQKSVSRPERSLSQESRDLLGLSPQLDVQVVARSVETCLHKLHELGFDVTRIVSGCGSAPLSPVAVGPPTA